MSIEVHPSRCSFKTYVIEVQKPTGTLFVSLVFVSFLFMCFSFVFFPCIKLVLFCFGFGGY